MQISAAIGSVTNYKSRITIPDVLFDRNYITSALLTSHLAVLVTLRQSRLVEIRFVAREKMKM